MCAWRNGKINQEVEKFNCSFGGKETNQRFGAKMTLESWWQKLNQSYGDAN